MAIDVLSFGTNCDEILEQALSATGLILEKADFTSGPTEALKRAIANIKRREIKSVVCSVSPPSPLLALELLCAVKDSTSFCNFYLFAESQEELDKQVPDTLPSLLPLSFSLRAGLTDRETALTMGVKKILVNLTEKQLRDELENRNNDGGQALV